MSEFASGGVIGKPKLALVGEAGNEPILPKLGFDDWMMFGPMAISNNITILQEAFVKGPQDRQVQRHVARIKKYGKAKAYRMLVYGYRAAAARANRKRARGRK